MMIKSVLAAAAAATALLAAQPAAAQSALGFGNQVYVRGEIGATIGGKADFDAQAAGSLPGGAPFTLNAEDEVDLDVGALGAVAFGVTEFPLPGWRLELEGVYTNTETDDEEDNLGDIFDDDDGVLGDDDLANDDSSSADINVYGGMVNLIYDFNNYSYRGFKPFVGGGVGYGNVEVELADDFKADDSGLLWQARAGVGYDFNEQFGLELGYRYLRAEDIEFDDDNDDDAFTLTGEADVNFHVISVGARYKFGGGAGYY